MESTTLSVSLENAYYVEEYFPSKNNVQYSNHTSIRYRDVCFTMIYSLFCLLGVIGNGLVIWVGIFKMRNTVTVLWFLSLALADFTFLLLCPLMYVQMFFGYKKPDIVCKVIDFSLYLNMGVSVLQITVISVDRCICVVFPVWCQNHRRPKPAYTIVLIIWMISSAWFVVAIRYSKAADINGRNVCIVEINESSYARKTTLQFVLSFLLPFIIIVFCYIMIVWRVKRRNNTVSYLPLRTIGAVVLVFFVCWFPSHLFFLILIFGTSVSISYVDDSIYLFTILLVILNSCINPILYVFIGRDFKEKLFGSFQAKLEKAFIDTHRSGLVKQEKSMPH
ncbi:chemerin-like receptor 1 [Dendropsophus ebraccatus]|uniref:chemerin-like receptor 1 n=1 Tax=Dendropsophus ebraccatus TaxID=150705 RepID=UPI003831C7FD